METKTEWAHLPNAHIIDAILDSLKKHPKEWDTAGAAVWDAAWAAARTAAREAAGAAGAAAWDAAWAAARTAAREAARDAARDAAGTAARTSAGAAALVALAAWDYSADILRMPLEAITMLAKLNNPAAVLILPAAQLIHKHPEVLTLERSI